MGSKVRSVERQNIPEGVRLIARSHSNRGTTYILSEITIYRKDLSLADYKVAVARGVAELMGQ